VTATAPGPAPDRGVYGISVAAELVGMGIQNLRLYEARGLLDPARTDGGTRRYSADDLDRLHRIRDLLEAGLNLAGIAMVLQLETENADLRTERDSNWLATAPIPKPKPPNRPARPEHAREAPTSDAGRDLTGESDQRNRQLRATRKIASRLSG
jgi:MerR family transcriptional regulator, heat shock protein HspR